MTDDTNLQPYVSQAPDAEAADVYGSVRQTLIAARRKTAAVINSAMVEAYWEIGRRITESQGERADYGQQLMKYLSERLTAEFGAGFTERNLRAMRQFYQAFPIRHTVCAELSWSHYRLLMKVSDKTRREFYASEAAEGGWTVRQLDRQIHSFFYERLLATPTEGRADVATEIKRLEPKPPADTLLKDPYVLEFLDLKEPGRFHEGELEQALIDKLHDFLLELGKGFAFVARQKRISDDTDHYYIDLVLYNYILKCFVLIDLKTGRLTHQDVGQMDSYVRIYDAKMRREDDNPTIGIILCADKSEIVAKYSVLADGKNIFASKYVLYLPTEEELRREIERERAEIEARFRWEQA
jgi:predicted nuclease of restriction endonuclease-like (RecB) superfamily